MSVQSCFTGKQVDTTIKCPLWFLVDFETTGLSVKTERIIEIGGKLFNPLISVTQSSFSSLVNTTCRIPEIGNYQAE